MKVFVAGATGVLGRRLLQQFRSRGHSVIGLVRSTVGEKIVKSLGAEARFGDLFDSDSLARASGSAEVFVHAATSIPKKTRPNLSDWALNDRIRREGTQALTNTAGKVGVKLFLMQSVAWVNQPRDGSRFDEASPIQSSSVLQSAIDAEKITAESGKGLGFEAAILRCGFFYSADSFHTKLYADYLKRGRMAVNDGGKAKWSMLHVEDAAGAFVAAAEAGRSGLWNVIDNYPVPTGEFFSYFAEKIGSHPPRHLPGWLLRLLAGKYAAEFLSVSMEASNARFKKDLGWEPRYPTYKEGLSEVIARWREEGLIKSGD